MSSRILRGPTDTFALAKLVTPSVIVVVGIAMLSVVAHRIIYMRTWVFVARIEYAVSALLIHHSFYVLPFAPADLRAEVPAPVEDVSVPVHSVTAP